MKTVVGLYEEGARIVFPDGWVFPFGSNHLASVEVMAWGEVQPDSRSHDQIAAFGSRLSLVPGVSSFYGRRIKICFSPLTRMRTKF